MDAGLVIKCPEDAQPKIGYVYILRDPFTAGVAYVGSAYDPRQRYLSHLDPNRLAVDKTAKGEWIRSVLHRGSFPEMVIVSAVKHKDLVLEEAAKYRELIANGANLLNSFEPRDTRKVKHRAAFSSCKLASTNQ
jgi:hypothetical protein